MAVNRIKNQVLRLLFELKSSHKLLSLRPLISRNLGKEIYIYKSICLNTSGKKIRSYGVSIDSKETAIIKCLGEAVERIYTKKTATTTYLKGLQGSGKAGAPNSYLAKINGAYELIERDAFMTVFLNRILPPKIDLSAIQNLSLKKLIKKLGQNDTKTFFYEITNDVGVRSFLCLLLNKRGSYKINGKVVPLFAMGIKSHLDQTKAIQGSIEEACLELVVKSNILLKTGVKEVEDFSIWPVLNYHTLKHYLSVKQFSNIELKPVKRFKPKEELKTLIYRIKRAGFKISFTQIKDTDLKDKKYYIFQAIIPDFQPLYLEKKDQYINKKRLKQVLAFFRR